MKNENKSKRGAPKGNRNSAGNKGGGRPTSYKTEYDQQAFRLSLLGLSDAELADFFEISVSTLNAWKKEYLSFSDALRRGKTEADGKVARALYKRALGFEYTETTREAGKLIKTVTKIVVPDVGAVTLWLKNRQRDKWRDREIDLSDLSDEQLDRLLDRLKRRPAESAGE